MTVGGSDLPVVNPATVAKAPAGGSHKGAPRGGRVRRLTGNDRIVVFAMVIVPLFLTMVFVVLPAIASVVLSFASWDGIGGVSNIKWIGFENYKNIATNYPPFWPAIRHNVLWLVVLFFIATPLGMFFAVILDKNIRFSRFYQTPIYLPVVLSLALIGFIWQLQYSRDFGLINAILQFLGLQEPDEAIDWFGDPNIAIWAALAASAWRHAGYIMLLYLAGLKGVDPSLREAASVDGANEVKTFFSIVFPVLRPINIIVVVITVIESLRAFDLVWIINKGRNGLELISALVTSNVTGEASRIGFGSALATIMLAISLIFITIYLATIFKEEEQ
ncbi:carbohydrate ABC transporter permease [Kineosporia sp. R_H_3]|uniref:carbohydrate ABC transporter permease n=1 Tax=Kineosporia sp. R_H_3 TaxID=1961848 RepID=UPI000B4B5421|nr:sugar ABC transporter permease [Kineosporia sp. R_H_3]